MTGMVVAFFGVNPSAAGDVDDDPSSRKIAGFAKLMGARRYLLGNPFGLVSTDVHGLRDADDPVGPGNVEHLARIIDEADMLVPCWGRRDKVPRELRVHVDCLAAALRASGKPTMTLGLTKCGQPRHPLMLAYSTPLVPWTV